MKCSRKARRVLTGGCQAGNQSHIVLHQASWALCVSVRGAVLPVTSQWIVTLISETIILRWNNYLVLLSQCNVSIFTCKQLNILIHKCISVDTFCVALLLFLSLTNENVFIYPVALMFPYYAKLPHLFLS